MRRFYVQPLVTILLGAAALGQFGVSKTRVNLPVRHPPSIYIPGRQLRLEVRSEVPNGASAAAQMRAFLEQEFTRAAFEMGGAPETLVRVVVTRVEGRVYRESRQEEMYLHTGYHKEYDKKGNATEQEDCAARTVNVTHHIARGALSLSLSVQDIRTGARLNDEQIPVDVDSDTRVGGPQLCSGATYDAVPPGYSDVVSLNNSCIGAARGQVQRRLFGWVQGVEVLLAKSDELKVGNEMAVAGQWQRALASWQAASIRDAKKEAYRQYNLGVAEEAIAYSSSDPATALEALQQAEAAYGKAQELKPDEKYFRPAFTRVNSGRKALQEAQEQATLRRAEASKRQALLQEQTAPPPPPAPPEETPQAKEFTAYLRLRLPRLGRQVEEAERQALIDDGTRFGLGRAEAATLLAAEELRVQETNKRLDRYRDFYRECWQDKVITAEERQQLEAFAKAMGISEEQGKLVEAEFQPPKPPKPPPAKPRPRVAPPSKSQ